MNGDAKELPRGVFIRGGVYWIRYADADGRERKEKIGPRLSLAVTLYQKRKTEAFETRKLPELRQRREVRFADLAADFLEFGRIHHTRRTQMVDRQRMEKVLQEFRARKIETITPQEIVRFLGSEETWSSGTRNRYRALLSKCFSLAIRNGLTEENPMKKVERFRENPGRIRFLDLPEEKKLRRVLDAERIPEFVLAVNSGMRRGEQYHLKWADVDIGRKQISVEISKNGERRHIDLNDEALDALRALRDRALEAGSEFVVVSTESERAGNYPQWFEAAIAAAKIKNFRWHDLRHTFGSRLAMAGVDLRTIQELMGHKTLAMTVRYSHLSAPHKKAAVDALKKYAPKKPRDPEAKP